MEYYTIYQWFKGEFEMVDESLKKDLIVHKIYTAWQFIEYTEKNIAIAEYCAQTIDSLINKMTMKTIRWEQDIAADFTDEILDNGQHVKQLTVTTENAPTYEVRVAGEKVDPWFLFDKLLRDFFQYVMNSFDSLSQIINAGLLANNSKKVDSCDIQIMARCFGQQTYSAAFPTMHAWLDKLSQSPEFQYIEAINNRTKHTADIANKLSMGILGSSNTAQIGPFFRKDAQHEEKDLSAQLCATLKFLNDSWDEFLDVFKQEYVNDTFTQRRRHSIKGVRQQKFIDNPDNDLAYAYIGVENTFDSMPDEIYVLLVKEEDNEVYAHESPFNAILVTGSSNIEILGRYTAAEKVGDDCLLHYRKYIKDQNLKGVACMYHLYQEKKVFYRCNPFFDIETVSDDTNFINKVSLPF